MPMVVVVGAQWGDEGKGKIVDIFSEEADIVARYGGGANAGHTLVVNGKKMVTHLVPSGIAHSHTKVVLGGGMVFSPEDLINELESLKGLDTSPDRVFLSHEAHVVTPLHKALDRRDGKTIGTTCSGIGPTYSDKAKRVGVRAVDMLDPNHFGQKILDRILLENWESLDLGKDPADIAHDYSKYAQRLTPYIRDTSRFLNVALKQGKTVLAEGAQGVLLDIDHGTYPYCTSSYTVSGGACTGLGVSPKYVSRVVGVAKAFQTRVGGGPFPTEVFGDVAAHIGSDGKEDEERGATTGRRRKRGWLSLCMLKYAAEVSGIDSLAITKLDVLTCLDTIKACVGCSKIEENMGVECLSTCVPVYKEFSGWKEDITNIRCLGDLPKAAQVYLRSIEDYTGMPIGLVSVGQKRGQEFKI